MDNGVSGILYFKTPQGICKLLESIFSLCAFISSVVFSTYWANSYGFLHTMLLLAFLYALVILILSIINIATSNPGEFSKIDCGISIIFTVLIFSSVSIFAPLADYDEAQLATVILGYMSGIAYLANALLKVFKG